MRATILTFSTSVLCSVCAFAQSPTPPAAGPADLCQELLAYAEAKAAASSAAAPPRSAVLLPPRTEGEGTGTQGGGSVDPNAALTKVPDPAAPPMTPVAPGAASEPAISPYAVSDAALFKLASGTTLQQVRDAAKTGDRQTCRNMTQALRRAGADLSAALIALAAYEPRAPERR